MPDSLADSRARSPRRIASIANISGSGGVLPFNKALVYLGLGDRKEALDNLERALSESSQMMAWIGQDKIFDSLRSEPSFVAMLKRVNFREVMAAELLYGRARAGTRAYSPARLSARFASPAESTGSAASCPRASAAFTPSMESRDCSASLMVVR
ncbi:MAG: hypothetical protein ABIQ10_10615 [Gemmatimonadaceae bacterium]